VLVKILSVSVFVIILFLFSAIKPSIINAENTRNYGFSAGTAFGVVFGESFELVYPGNDTKGELLSELTWEMKPVFYFGLYGQFARRNLTSAPGFFASFLFKVGLPGDSGVHENRDWMSAVNAELTHFSTHTNRTDRFFWLDVDLGFSIPIRQSFFVKPFLNFSWMHFAFSGRDGHGQYAIESSPGIFYPIDDMPRIVQFNGLAITYQQDWLILAAGLTAGTTILSPFTLELSFKMSPLTYCIAVDHHFHRAVTFYDFTSFGLFIEPSIRASMPFGNFDILFELTYRFIGRTRGPAFREYATNIGVFVPSGEAGAALSLMNSRFIIRYRI